MIVPVLINKNSFGIGDMKNTITEATQDFFGAKFFSLDLLNSKVDDAVQKYESPEVSNSEIANPKSKLQNYTNNDTQETTMKPLDAELETPIETTTKLRSSIVGDFPIEKHSSQETSTEEFLNHYDNATSNVTDSNLPLDVSAVEEENEIDVNRQLNKGLNDIWTSMRENLHRRFVSSIHHNIVTLLRRTMFPKQQKSFGADQSRLLLAPLFITIFGLWIAFIYTVPFIAPRVRRSLSEIDSFETQFRSDPVDIMLDVLSIEDYDGTQCRERLVCDARYLVSSLPYFAQNFSKPYLLTSSIRTSSNDIHSNNITRGYKYTEAAARGAAREDCSIYKCPHSSAKLVTGWL
ncbi:hypothetical protein FHG87_010405 [Trinorchestia longiramus]|nr:hypothetical protein FHG87_010405 [Trinorchestia longiramus]